MVVVEKASSQASAAETLSDKELSLRLEELLDQGLSKKDALKRLAKELVSPKRELYLRLIREKGSVEEDKVRTKGSGTRVER